MLSSVKNDGAFFSFLISDGMELGDLMISILFIICYCIDTFSPSSDIALKIFISTTEQFLNEYNILNHIYLFV